MSVGSLSLPKDQAVSERMRRQRTQDTAIEMAVRRTLYSYGFRYRIQYPVPCFPRRTIDIAFPSRKLAVNIDGCFWHGCERHRPMPRSNSDWWRRKINENRERDRQTDLHLAASGWKTLRFWEHEPLGNIVRTIIETVKLFEEMPNSLQEGSELGKD